MTHLTYLDLETQAERIVACLKALEDYDLAGIKGGALQRFMTSALRIVGEVETMTHYTSTSTNPALRRMVSRLSSHCRSLLEAKADLGFAQQNRKSNAGAKMRLPGAPSSKEEA